MPDWRGDTQLGDLPKELIDSILVLLPSKDVGRCRAVSKSWRSITSRYEFMIEHHRRQPSLPIVDGDGRSASLVVVRDAGARTTSQQLWPFLQWFPTKVVRHEGDTCFMGWLDSKLTSINVRVMQDYKAKIRAFKYRIDLSTMEASKTTLFNFLQKEMDNIIIVHGVAVEQYGSAKLGVFFNKKHVQPYGMLNNGMSKYCMLLTHHNLKEGIVPILGHEMQKDQGH